ncbi:hypothetical protein [Tenacibaculum aestuarii]|uniref:hypothetical protein n=1 Tax=Tenacibaculum aestuarii TaxID=362781 RepID=UPI00389369B0
MKLTDQHIEQLYKFTRQHFVEHYDVQTELVDHLANDIEQIWEENPTLTFEQARDKSFKKFGVFGFMNVVEEKQKQMSKKYRKIIWSYLKQWFTLPKIILTLSSVFIFYFLFQIPYYGKYFFYGLEVFFFLFIIIRCQFLIKQQKQRVKETGKNWLLEDIIFKMASTNFIVFFCNVYNIFRLAELMHRKEFTLFISVFSVLLILVSYITLELIPKKSEKLLEEQYPEYKFANS